jgi:DNA-directed RNA polymerase subunit M/transcription elongation factor TFIIS
MNDTQSQFIAVCPGCSASLRVNFNKLAQHIACPQCHRTFVAGEASLPATQRSGERPALLSNQPHEHVDRIEAICPGCKASLHVRQAYIGNDVRCKYCDQVFQVRAPVETQTNTEHEKLDSGQKLLQADHEQLSVAHNLLQADHERLKTEHTELRENLERVTAELDSMRAALGSIAPEEVGSLANERQSLADEVHRLRDEIQATLGTQSERDLLLAERQQWVLEHERADAERDLLVKQLAERDEHDAAVRSEHERLTGELKTALSEIEQLRISLAQNDEATHNECDYLRSEVENLRRELELADERHREELGRLNEQLTGLEQTQSRRGDEHYQHQEHQESDDQLKFGSEDFQRRRWGEQQPVLGVFSDEVEAQASSSGTAVFASRGEGPTTTAELDELRSQLAELGQLLDESERLNREMVTVLGGLGIRCRTMRG